MKHAWADRFGEFHERASSIRGVDDFGDVGYHEGLRVLLDAFDCNPPLGEEAVAAAERLVVSTLVSRLHTQEQWSLHPAFRAREIPKPLIVIGAPRTGTTALHNLLDQDPQFQGLPKWLAAAPLVRPPRKDWDADPQYRACVAATERMHTVSPAVMQAHGVLADEVDECLTPMSQSFCSNRFPSQFEIPAYDQWLAQADEKPSYARYKDVLRLVGMNDDRRWLLKNPSHAFGIQALLAIFPDAFVIQTHRHPVSSLASLIDLLDNLSKANTGRGIDRSRRMAREIRFWSEAMNRAMAAQVEQPDRFFNVRQTDIRADPIGVVQSIYAKFGFDLSSEAEHAMKTWAVAQGERTHQARSHDSNIEDEIRRSFADYMQRYGYGAAT